MTLLNDLQYSSRMILKRPGVSLLAVIALGLGIGLTTTMFSIVQGAILRGLPFDESHRILYIGRRSVTQPDTASSEALPLHDFVDFQASQRSFESMAGFSQLAVNVSGGVAPERYRAARITTNTLHVLRVAPVLGRDFIDADGVPGAPPVALISHRVWTTQFEQDPGVLNQTVRVNGVPTTIVGVLPERFAFPQAQDFWLPVQITLPVKRGDGQRLQAFGRLNPGQSPRSASTEFAAIAGRLAQEHPENKGFTTQLQPYVERFIGREPRVTLTAMLGAVFGVLLIACANVMSLQLARAAERTKEFAVRAAIGAGRGRVIRQLLLEGLLLSAAGALLGLGVGGVGIGFFNRSIQDTTPPFWIDIRIDTTVLAFVMGLTVIATMVSSLAPALRATRMNLNAALTDEGRGNTGLQMGRFSRWLVVGEVLLSCALLVVSGLMIKSVVTLGNVVYPFATRDVFTAGFTLDEAKYPGDPEVLRAMQRLEERWSAVPGVRRVALSSGLPGQTGTTVFEIEGRPAADPDQRPSAQRMVVSTGFFETVQVSATRGRLFTPADTADSTRVLVADEAFVAKFLPGEEPLGRRIRLGGDANAQWWTIVGVVPTLAAGQRQDQTVEGLYLPLTQSPLRGALILASTNGTPANLAMAIRMAARDVDPDQPISINAQGSSVEELLRSRNWHIRVLGTLFMSFGVAALLMASAGLYGVMAFSVRRRTQEIGVRMALGASRRSIVGMVVWEGAWRVGLGIALGLVPAYFLGGAMKALFFRVTATDPVVVGSTVLALLVSGLIAALVPAMRAASINPLIALKDS